MGRKISMELALLKFAPELPACESSCRRMVAVILEEGLFEKWSEDVQSAWYDHLLIVIFD